MGLLAPLILTVMHFFFRPLPNWSNRSSSFFFLSLKVLQFFWSFYNCLELIFIMNSLRKSSCSYICAQWRMLVIKILLSLSCYGFTFAGSWMSVFVFKGLLRIRAQLNLLRDSSRKNSQIIIYT